MGNLVSLRLVASVNCLDRSDTVAVGFAHEKAKNPLVEARDFVVEGLKVDGGLALAHRFVVVHSLILAAFSVVDRRD